MIVSVRSSFFASHCPKGRSGPCRGRPERCTYPRSSPGGSRTVVERSTKRGVTGSSQVMDRQHLVARPVLRPRMHRLSSPAFLNAARRGRLRCSPPRSRSFHRPAAGSTPQRVRAHDPQREASLQVLRKQRRPEAGTGASRLPAPDLETWRPPCSTAGPQALYGRIAKASNFRRSLRKSVASPGSAPLPGRAKHSLLHLSNTQMRSLSFRLPFCSSPGSGSVHPKEDISTLREDKIGATLSFDPPDLARCGLFPWVEGCRSWQMRYLRKSDRSARALLPCETTLLAPPPSDCRAPPSRQREHLRDASSSGGPHPPRRHGGGAPTRPIRRAVGVARQQVPVRRRRAGDQW